MDKNTFYTEEQLLEAYKVASKDTQDILLDERFGAAVQVIGKDNGLTPEQALELEDVVLHTLLGLEPQSTLQERVEQATDIPTETAEKVARDLTENFFGHKEDTPQKQVLEQSSTPTPLTSTLTTPPISENPSIETPPTTPRPPSVPTPPKPIVGVDKISTGFPSEPTEVTSKPAHMFEEKLRAATTPKPVQTQIESQEKEPAPTQADPYREATE